jgi:metal-dependent amidase/aminoacylase/carboxypeptidase family protein
MVTWITTPLVNAPDQVEIVAGAAHSVLGTENVLTDMEPTPAERTSPPCSRPHPAPWSSSATARRRTASSHNVHTPHYDFNDEAIAVGVAVWVALVRQQLSADAVPRGQ